MKVFFKGALLWAFLMVFPLLIFGEAKPKKVALISSSGVNNDYRSWGEYDGTLKELGWQYDKFRNTELDKFFSKSDEYDLVLTTSLWNYGDPQDMRAFIPKWLEFLRKGGIIILTDMAYAPMCDWLSSLDPELFITYGDARRDIGDLSALDLSSPSSFLSYPHYIGAFNYWAHFPQWGRKYQVWAKTKGGTALGLYTSIEGGILIVTTGFALSPQMLENLYTNALMLRCGADVHWEEVPKSIVPGEFKGKLKIKNLRDGDLKIEVQAIIEDENKEMLSQSEIAQLSLKPGEEKSMSFVLPCPRRGEFTAVARYRTSEMKSFEEVLHSFKVPPLVEVSLNRIVFSRQDKLEAEILTAPRQGEEAKINLLIQNSQGKIIWSKKLVGKGRDLMEIPLRTFAPGIYSLRASVETKSEKGEAIVGFKIENVSKINAMTKIGERGELLINGKPFFPLGTYHIGAEDFKKAKEMGFNCITSPIYGPEQKELTPEQLSWHNSAYKEGLWVITELSEYIRGGRRNFEEAKAMVSQLRLHPATIAHYVIDEPLGCGIGVEKVRDFCQLVKEVDPEHITFVNEVPGAVVNYAGIGDVTGTDPYPIGAGTPKSLAWVGEAVEGAVKASKGKPVWAVIQAHRQPPANSQNRYPTPEELRCMSYLALNHGAKGILFYAWGDAYQTEKGIWESGFKFDPQLMEYFPILLRELESIGMEYVLGEVERVSSRFVSPSTLDVVIVKYKGKEKVIAINPLGEEVEGKIKLPSGEIAHNFKPFEVFISQFYD